MDKLKMHSVNKVDENVEKIARLFPNCVTETIVDDKLTKVIDFDMLKQELSSFVVEGREERYQFTWPDKKKSVLLANAPINKTLRPCREESVNFDTTGNLYIEGDNLEVLKLLQETYLGKIKMIYIDPPYNTGSDFVYEDDFAQDAGEYIANSGQYDAEGNRLVQNTESNGRFHTDWLNMIYPRLKLAKDLLTDDGVIFISISEEEVHLLKQICNEVFGATNFRNAIFTRRYDKNLNRQFMEQGLATMNTGLEYILMYSKNPLTTYNPVFRASSEERTTQGYWKGFWNDADRPTMRYDVLGVTPDSGQWKWKRELANEAVQNYIEYIKRYSTQMTLEEYWESTGRSKKFIRRNPNGKGKNMGVEHWVAPADGILRNTNWSDLLASKPTGVDVPFDSPKNVEVLLELLRLSNIGEDGVVLDFFSGSATTAHAVMQLNAEDGGQRKFIMVQLPEVTDEKSEAYKAGYKTICEIGKERIRRAGRKIVDEVGLTAQNLDIGFRVLKCDSSNMKDVYYSPSEYTPSLFSSLTDNIKEDRKPEDLLFQVMLDLGVLLSSKIEETIVAGKKVFSVADGYLIACFDEDITDETIKEIAQKKPYYFVMCDGGYASDSVATNFDQVFAAYSPSTIRKVL